MPSLPSRKVLESMRRVDLQKLCKDYGVKANLKSEALIDLLLDTQSAAIPTKYSLTSNPHSTRRSVSTRQPSRAGPSRITSMIIHEVDEEDGSSRRSSHAEIEKQIGSAGPDPPQHSMPEAPQQQPSSTLPPRTRKAKELQRRLGVGKPVAAGGTGPRAITRSSTLSKGKQMKPSKAFKAQPAIPEECMPEPIPEYPTQEKNNETAETVIPTPKALPNEPNSLTSLSMIDEYVANALRPLHEQLQALRSELEQMHMLQMEVTQLKSEVEQLRSNASTTHQANTKNSSPKKPYGLGGLGIPSNINVRNNLNDDSDVSGTESQNTLGKRPREPSTPSTDMQDGTGEEQDHAPILKKAKLSRDDSRNTDGMRSADHPGSTRTDQVPVTALQESHAPGYSVFREIDEPPEGADEHTFTAQLSDYITMPSPSGTVASAEYTRHDATNGPENQNPFTYDYAPIPSTPAPQPNSNRQGPYGLSGFPYFEAPRSPTPSGSAPGSNDNGLVDRKQGDMFQPFGLPPPGRPTSRTQSTINPTVLAAEKESEPPITSNEVAAGLGLRAVSSSSFVYTSLDTEDAPPMRVTMYGTELDGDTRFGDFGVEGVATGFWTGGRF